MIYGAVNVESTALQYVLKKVVQNYLVIFQKLKTVDNSGLLTCVVNLIHINFYSKKNK